MTSPPAPMVVSAAVIERHGRFLVTRRSEGTHLAGRWEFPGGKCEEGESVEACLAREILEELAASVSIGAEIYRTTFVYPDRTIELRFFRCELAGDPVAMMGQDIRWVRREDLHTLEFPPADRELIDLLLGDGSAS
ncbi:MAG: (deoxy)nucleoside triphosphate pyrophosphohydrolase [Acidobacteria bacterium]|nr:(deoxy)nucleoside triphosphate pyrophosphohydrolase [Acidobacteriota bacterium]